MSCNSAHTDTRVSCPASLSDDVVMKTAAAWCSRRYGWASTNTEGTKWTTPLSTSLVSTPPVTHCMCLATLNFPCRLLKPVLSLTCQLWSKPIQPRYLNIYTIHFHGYNRKSTMTGTAYLNAHMHNQFNTFTNKVSDLNTCGKTVTIDELAWLVVPTTGSVHKIHKNTKEPTGSITEIW